MNGRKRHLLVDTQGFIHALRVHPANIQDRDGALLLLEGKTKEDFPRIKKLWLDAGYAGQCVEKIKERFDWDVEVVKRLSEGFQILKRRWVVERTFGWLGRSRRLSKDYEQKIKSCESFIYLGMSALMLRRWAPS